MNKGISRIQIAKVLQMDKSTVTKIVSNLLSVGIIKTMKEEDIKIKGGRKPVPLCINSDYGSVLGIEIQTDSYNAVIINLDGSILFDSSRDVDFGESTVEQVFWNILEELLPEAEKHDVLGIVLGLSGIINSNEGIIRKSNPLNIYKDYHFTKAVQDKLDVPIFIENDANCCCWGELTTNRLNRPQNMLYMLGEFREVETHHTYYSGIGFGFGIVLNGEVYSGPEYSAGEFKSIFSDTAAISQFSLDDEVIKGIQEKPEDLAVLFRELTRNIALVMNFFNLNHVVLGGEIEKYKDMIELMLSQEIQRNWLHPDQMTYSVRNSNLGEKAVAFGAACLFIQNLFGVPEMNQNNNSSFLKGIELLESIKDLDTEEQDEADFSYTPI
ncbi:MAG: ROK family protein [Spirochaetales bacterium]|nr:ROK family protein [Spirochaetales bacterium]